MQGDSSVVVGSKALLVNRADGDYKDFVAGGFGSSEMARTLRDRVALRGRCFRVDYDRFASIKLNALDFRCVNS